MFLLSENTHIDFHYDFSTVFLAWDITNNEVTFNVVLRNLTTRKNLLVLFKASRGEDKTLCRIHITLLLSINNTDIIGYSPSLDKVNYFYVISYQGSMSVSSVKTSSIRIEARGGITSNRATVGYNIGRIFNHETSLNGIFYLFK